MIAILDLGSQYTHLIVRKIREIGVDISIFKPDAKIDFSGIKGIILSGGPGDGGSVKIREDVFNQGIPVMGICLGMEYIAYKFSGEVKIGKREYGCATLNIVSSSRLFKDIPQKSRVWMSHQYEVKKPPSGFSVTASSPDTKISAFEKEKIFGLQFHPEVSHTEYGQQIFRNFTLDICKETPLLNAGEFIEEKIKEIQDEVKDSRVIAGLSGGIDSSVVAFLLKKALGDKFIPVFVDTGLLRIEDEGIVEKFKGLLDVVYVDARGEFISALKGVFDPEEKRRIIGRKFIEIFARVSKEYKGVAFLAQGTLYPDRIESMPQVGGSATIKTHHNVGGLPKNIPFRLIEPLKDLFKDQVRVIGKELGIPKNILHKHPFPGPGFAVRIIGEITEEKISLLKDADHVLTGELKDMGIYDDIWQAFCVLLPVLSVGVMGDERTYEYAVVIRAVVSTDGMTASPYRFEWKELLQIGDKIVREVKGINRVLYDITSKPPATIEWE